MTALPLNASLPAGPARSTSQPDAAARGVSKSSPFPALFGDMVAADGRQDAAPLRKGAVTPPRSDMPPVQTEPVQIELVQIDPAAAELPAAASSVTTPVPESLPEGPSTITAEQIGRPAGHYPCPAGNPFTEFAAASPSTSEVAVAIVDPSSFSKRPIMVSRTHGEAEPPRATDAELQAKMNLAALPVAQTPTPLLQIETHTIEFTADGFNQGEPRQPVFPLRAVTPIDVSVRVSTGSTLESSTGETAGLAFAARLVPLAATATALQTAPEAPPLPPAFPDAPARLTAAGNPALAASESNGKGATPPMAPSGSAANHGGDNPPTAQQDGNAGLPDRSRKNQEPQTIADDLPQTAMGRVIPHAEYTPEQRVNPTGQAAATSTAELAQPKAGPELPPATETAKAPGAARDIRLEIGGGDHRVEVRLMERGGEVHVDVRTPDTHLASTLREDLPALSSRLTESGFRTETWHPGASGLGDWHRAEAAAGGTPQDTDNQQGQQGRDRQAGDRQPQQQKAPEEQLNQKQRGKDFKWFMSSLR